MNIMNIMNRNFTSFVERFFIYKRYYKSFSTKAINIRKNVVADRSHVLPFSDIPLVKGYPVIGSLVEFVSNIDKLHELLQRRLKEYGPIYREQIGYGKNAQQVFTANVDDWEHILHGEARGHPADKIELWSVDSYTEKKGLTRSIFNLKGDEYVRVKEGVKPLLVPRNIAKLVPELSDVTDDLMDLLASDIKADGTIQDIRETIHKWSFECGGMIVFKTRFGMLNDDENAIEENILKLYRSSRLFFQLLFRLETGLPHHRTLLTKLWREYERSIDEFNERSEELFHKYGEYVTDKNADLSEIERIALARGVIMASADTTAHTALWALIELSNNPEVQENIYNEVSEKSIDGQLTSTNLNLPYLRGFLKEVFRVRPIMPISPKILTEDLILSGYEVPSGCTVNLMLGAYNKDEWFVDADTVKPERWHRRKKSSVNSSPAPHPFAVLPFGHGQRSCLGRRIAENELYIFISKVVRRFKITPIREYDANFCIFVIPEGEITLKLEERK